MTVCLVINWQNTSRKMGKSSNAVVPSNSGPRTPADLFAFIGLSKRGNPKNSELRVKIYLIQAKKGLEIGSVATV